MKSESVNLFNRVLLALLALLGFSACGEGEDPRDEYGCPITYYRTLGRVTDTADVPIKGIKVVKKVKYYYGDEGQGQEVVVGFTDADGRFADKNYGEEFPHELIFSDVDGEDNGGLYRSASLSSDDMIRTKVKNDGHWTTYYEVEANAKLEKE